MNILEVEYFFCKNKREIILFNIQNVAISGADLYAGLVFCNCMYNSKKREQSQIPSKLTQKDVDIQAAFAVKQINLCGRKSIQWLFFI